MSAYAPWLILAGIALAAWVAERVIAEHTKVTKALKDAFDKQDAKDKQ